MPTVNFKLYFSAPQFDAILKLLKMLYGLVYAGRGRLAEEEGAAFEDLVVEAWPSLWNDKHLICDETTEKRWYNIVLKKK